MARGGRRGRSRQVNLISQEDDRNEEIQTLGGEEANQVKVFAAESNGTVTRENELPNTQQIAKIEREDVEAKINYWQSAVLCSVLGANPPYEIMQGFIKRIWGAFEIDKILQIRKGVFLPKQNREHFGIALKTDKYTRDKTIIKYVRLLIDVPVDGNFLDHIEQQVHYEWKPTKCSHYMMFGHEETSCRKKGGVRTEWRPVQKDNSKGSPKEQPMQTSQQPLGTESETFTQVPKKSAAKQSLLYTAGQTAPEMGNPFLALELSEDGVNNSSPNIKGRIWIAWQPRTYKVEVLQKSDQLMHSHVTQVSTNKKFYITFVYGMNHDQQRQQMWEDLKALSQQMTEAWCTLGDLNVVLHKDGKRGGNAIQDTELREMTDLLEYGELQEMRWNGAYFSWTNKTIWSRIDRALTNIHWYKIFDFTQNQYLTNGLSDHTHMSIQFPTSPKPKGKFQYCEMWSKHLDFNKMVDSTIPPLLTNPLDQLRSTMNKLKALLGKLQRDTYADLRELARGELTKLQQQLQEEPESTLAIQVEKEARDKYIDILSSSMALMKQQSKTEWISYGDDNTRTFFARAKHRRLASYIYQIRDTEGNLVEGFVRVRQAMMTFYRAFYAMTIWTELRKWWSHTPDVQNSRQLMRNLRHIKSPGVQKHITSGIITATFDYIWSARNHRIFKKQQITAHQTGYLIKGQVRSRILFLSKCSNKYNSHIDSIRAYGRKGAYIT
ncbi:LOW QUALITY PROTEIN: hypothetical protein Cgig2_025466 [Carnegiea gigantea]|uniref:Endonuclease/exonuclease/phosphatase domain-containing protein n=1 Tax=Carnegiea gigantea TaxID=171969 RepID=A0A9Q1GFF0_9CARY|nr:LOW QUALITY PROTEIN: hypothetical protein Cgig2_025466 [Carnegiea gigantea]